LCQRAVPRRDVCVSAPFRGATLLASALPLLRPRKLPPQIPLELVRRAGIAEDLVGPDRREVRLRRRDVRHERAQRAPRLGFTALARVEHREPRPRGGVRREVADLLPERRLRLDLAAHAGQAVAAEVVQVLEWRGLLVAARPPGLVELLECAGAV